MQIAVAQEENSNVTINMSGQYWEASDLIKFESYIHEWIDKGAKVIKVDLSRVTFVSSQALGLLVAAFRDIRQVDGKLILVGSQGTVREMIEIAGLDELMEIS